MAGTSGGAWIVAGAANLMAKKNRLNLVKAIFINGGMLSDECSCIPEDELETYEREWGHPAHVLSDIYKLHAKDFEKQ